MTPRPVLRRHFFCNRKFRFSFISAWRLNRFRCECPLLCSTKCLERIASHIASHLRCCVLSRRDYHDLDLYRVTLLLCLWVVAGCVMFPHSHLSRPYRTICITRAGTVVGRKKHPRRRKVRRQAAAINRMRSSWLTRHKRRGKCLLLWCGLFCFRKN